MRNKYKRHDYGVRGFYEGWYRSVYTDSFQLEDGLVSFPTIAGLGTKLNN
jgi:hypothetical protein